MAKYETNHKAPETLKYSSTEKLLDLWEQSDNGDYSAECATIRGWLMDELESRNPVGFNCWLDQDAPEDKDLRKYILVNPKTGLLPGDMITVHIYSGNREIITRNHGKKFLVYNKCGKLGIKWNTEHSPYICEGDEFTPFSTFAQSVIFERQSDGAKFYFSNITESLKEAAQ